MGSSASLQQFLVAVESIIGNEFVVVEASEVEKRARFTEPARFNPVAYLHPDDAGQVSEIMRLANVHGIGISVSGRGKNWGFGSATPSEDGSVVMMLDRLNRIVHVDEDLAYAVVEPGVTYAQLNGYLKQRRLKLWIDTVDGSPQSSVVGNALDRGLGLTPYGDHYNALCGLEVVLPTGEKLRTGGGPQSGPVTWNMHRSGSGPSLEGLFSQSNLGVVTLAGIWLMPEPSCTEMYIVGVHANENLAPVVDRLRALYLGGVLNARSHILNEFALLAASSQASSFGKDTTTALNEDELDAFRNKNRIARWTLVTALYGEPEQIRVNRSILQRSIAPYATIERITASKVQLVRKLLPWLRADIPGLGNPLRHVVLERMLRKSLLQLDLLPHVFDLHKGIPTERIMKSAYFGSSTPVPKSDLDPARDGCGELWFTPVVPFRGQDVVSLIARIGDICRAHQFNQFTSIKLFSNRAIMLLTLIHFDHRKQSDRERAGHLYADLCKLALAEGVQQYRVANIGWNNLDQWSPEYRQFCNKLKQVLDPGMVLAAGKYGIGGKPTNE